MDNFYVKYNKNASLCGLAVRECLEKHWSISSSRRNAANKRTCFWKHTMLWFYLESTTTFLEDSFSLSSGKHSCAKAAPPQKSQQPKTFKWCELNSSNSNLDIDQFILFEHNLESLADQYLRYKATSFCSFELSKCDFYWVWFITVVTLFSGNVSFRDQFLPRFLFPIANDREWFTVGSSVVQWSLSSIMHRSFSYDRQLARTIDIFAWVACVSESCMLINMTDSARCWSTGVRKLRVLNSRLCFALFPAFFPHDYDLECSFILIVVTINLAWDILQIQNSLD